MKASLPDHYNTRLCEISALLGFNLIKQLRTPITAKTATNARGAGSEYVARAESSPLPLSLEPTLPVVPPVRAVPPPPGPLPETSDEEGREREKSLNPCAEKYPAVPWNPCAVKPEP